MKSLRIALCALPLAAAPLLQDDDASHAAQPFAKEHAAVERAMKDYVEGFYEADPAKIERGVSERMKKMGYAKRGANAPYSDALHMTFEQAVELAKNWNADGKQGELLPYEIEIYEVTDKTACGKLVAQWGIDYFHLAKEDDAWKIHHVIWQTHPPKEGNK